MPAAVSRPSRSPGRRQPCAPDPRPRPHRGTAMEKIVFDHTGFITPSLEGSVRFWSEVMGFDPKPSVERKGDWVAPFTGVPGAELKIAHLFGHGPHLEFIEFGAAGGAAGEPRA